MVNLCCKLTECVARMRLQRLRQSRAQHFEELCSTVFCCGQALEEQALIPMYGAHPVELGLKTGAGFFKMFAADPRYRILFERAFPTAKIDSRSKTLLLPLRVLREASFLRGRRMTVIIIKATTTLCRTPPSAVRLCSSISTFRVFAVTVDSISAMPQFQKRQQGVQSTSTTPVSII